jgi:hypothetical protein
LRAQGGWLVADNCLGTRRVWIDMIGVFSPTPAVFGTDFHFCLRPDHKDREHMHNFNEFVMAQRSTWDVVYVAATTNGCFAVVG